MLTLREHFRLYGSLPEEIIESLIDMAEQIEDMPLDLWGEARAGFPDEDCLSDAINNLRSLAGEMKRSAYQDDVLGLSEELDDIQLELGRSAEYGCEELKKSQDAWKLLLRLAPSNQVTGAVAP